MKEIKLKAFYIICIIVFFVINTHAFLWSAKLWLPLATTIYTGSLEAGMKDIFLVSVIYTMITSVGNIFMLKRIGRERMGWFFAMTVADTLIIVLSVLLTIVLNNIREKTTVNVNDLMNGLLLVELYVVKEIMIAIFSRRKANRRFKRFY
jgi:hypothetical protein